MSETLYPVGYGTEKVTMAHLEHMFGPAAPIPAHPAYWRRVKAWIASKNGAIGIGGAYRWTQPVKPGFAPPGKSFHEKQTYASGFRGYAAIDLVHVNGNGKHRAPTWAEVPKQGSGHPDIQKFGVHCNVSGEPWHIQCIEMDGYNSWVNRGRPDPSGNFALPETGGGTPTTPPPSGGGSTAGARTPNPTLKEGDRGAGVKQLQNLCNFWGWGDVGNADGQFGPRTTAGVKEMQGAIGVTADGVYGPKTQVALESFLDAMANLSGGGSDSHAPGSRTLKKTSPQMNGGDVTYLQTTLKAQGLTISIDGYYGNECESRVKTMQGWNGLTKDGVCGPETWKIVFAYN